MSVVNPEIMECPVCGQRDYFDSMVYGEQNDSYYCYCCIVGDIATELEISEDSAEYLLDVMLKSFGMCKQVKKV